MPPPLRSIRLRRLKIVRKPSGAVLIYHRAPGGALTRLPDAPQDSAAFLAAYAAAERAMAAPPKGTPRFGPRSLAALADLYLDGRAFAQLAPLTRQSRRAILVRMVAELGAAPVRGIEPRHLEADLAKQTPAAGRNRLKVWRALMATAVAAGWRADDPAKAVTPPRVRHEPHRAWTAEDVARFRARWPLGTPQRTALELLYWTGARRSDVVRLGWQSVRDGWIRWRQDKTGRAVEMPIAAELAEALSHAPRDRLTFLETGQGAARTAKGFGAWWASACRAAGVDARAHGMRHALGVDAAEAGIDPHGIGAALGHSGSRESETYTRQASARKMASATIRKLERARGMESRDPKIGNGD